MAGLNGNENRPKGSLSTSWELWTFLREKAGLDDRNYDIQIAEELCKGLGIPLPCRDIKRELQERSISIELFIGAFLKAIQPYAQMMSDLCKFFYVHGVKKTNKEMKILFDFGKGPEDLGFHLEHFREVLFRYTKICKSVAIYGWNHDTLWLLVRVFEDSRSYEPVDSNAKDWLSSYGQNREFRFPLPTLPTTEVQQIDLWLHRAWHVWATITLECAKYGPQRDGLRQHAKRMGNQLTENDIDSKELVDFKEWDVKTLFSLDNDRWPESMLRGLFGFTEKILEIPETSRVEEAQTTIQQIQQLFSKLPRWVGKKEILTKELLELLNLPIWNRRYELYQTWVLTQIDKALDVYERTIHHVNGELTLRFSGTHIGTLETGKGRIFIWSELRSPLTNPLGEGRKGHIQPDYSLAFEPVTAPSQTVVAIECKQYRKANSKNFAAALVDYARGRPNAKVILVNYGGIPETVFDKVYNNLRTRLSIVGYFRPDKLEQKEIFRQTLLASVPKPVVREGRRRVVEKWQFDLVGVDVSASMRGPLSEERVFIMLQMLVHFCPSAELLAIDNKVKKKWANAESGLEELLSMSRDGGTNLPEALSAHNLERSVVLTDNHGRSQLSNMSNPPYLIIEAGIEGTLLFHFQR